MPCFLTQFPDGNLVDSIVDHIWTVSQNFVISGKALVNLSNFHECLGLGADLVIQVGTWDYND